MGNIIEDLEKQTGEVLYVFALEICNNPHYNASVDQNYRTSKHAQRE